LPGSRAFNEIIKLSDAKGVVYLPVLGGGGEATAMPGARRELPVKRRRRRRRAAARAGRILDRSRFFPTVNPTNQQQTIIQPAKEKQKPRILQQFVPLPNMVKIAKPRFPLPPS